MYEGRRSAITNVTSYYWAWALGLWQRVDMYMSYSWVSFWWKVTWQRNAEWRHSVRRPCDTMLIRSSILYGMMYRVASICFCIFQRCTSHRTMYMTYYTTYTWIRHDSLKAEYDRWFFFLPTNRTLILELPSYVTSLFHHAESSPFCNWYCLFTLLFLSKQTRRGRNIVSFFCFFLFICGRAKCLSREQSVTDLRSSCSLSKYLER